MNNKLQNTDEKFYFCPYCRTISFEDDLFYKKETRNFRCLSCNKTFSAESYNDTIVKKGGVAYKIMDDVYDGEDIEQAIAISIAYLYWDGHTHREIQKITRFSQEIIRKSMKYIYEEEEDRPEYLTKKQFLRKKLNVSEKDWSSYRHREYNAPIDKLKNFEQTIINAYNFGCTYADIEKLLQISSKTISTIINKNADNISLFCSHKVQVEHNKVSVINKKRLRKKRKQLTEK